MIIWVKFSRHPSSRDPSTCSLDIQRLSAWKTRLKMSIRLNEMMITENWMKVSMVMTMMMLFLPHFIFFSSNSSSVSFFRHKSLKSWKEDGLGMIAGHPRVHTQGYVHNHSLSGHRLVSKDYRSRDLIRQQCVCLEYKGSMIHVAWPFWQRGWQRQAWLKKENLLFASSSPELTQECNIPSSFCC